MTSLPGEIAELEKPYQFVNVIHGIRIRSFHNTGALAQIIDGGINFTFATIRLIGHNNTFLFLNEFYNDGTTTTPFPTEVPSTTPPALPTTTTLIPDFEVEHWGTINSRSRIISE